MALTMVTCWLINRHEYPMYRSSPLLLNFSSLIFHSGPLRIFQPPSFELVNAREHFFRSRSWEKKRSNFHTISARVALLYSHGQKNDGHPALTVPVLLLLFMMTSEVSLGSVEVTFPPASSTMGSALMAAWGEAVSSSLPRSPDLERRSDDERCEVDIFSYTLTSREKGRRSDDVKSSKVTSSGIE